VGGGPGQGPGVGQGLQPGPGASLTETVTVATPTRTDPGPPTTRPGPLPAEDLVFRGPPQRDSGTMGVTSVAAPATNEPGACPPTDALRPGGPHRRRRCRRRAPWSSPLRTPSRKVKRNSHSNLAAPRAQQQPGGPPALIMEAVTRRRSTRVAPLQRASWTLAQRRQQPLLRAYVRTSPVPVRKLRPRLLRPGLLPYNAEQATPTCRPQGQRSTQTR
jgi:hypothetical protein